MEYIRLYTITAYLAVMLLCLLGTFSKLYAANLLERLGLALMALWAVYRVETYSMLPLSSVQESIAVSSFLVFGLGSTWRILKRVYDERANRKKDSGNCDCADG